MKLYFFCVTAAQQGGETPIADCRAIYQAIDVGARGFRPQQIMYMRNFGDGLGHPWQQVFKTNDRAEVEAYCRANGIVPEWKANGLRVRYVRPAIARHPRTGALVWFNHGTFFHISTQEPAIRDCCWRSRPKRLPIQHLLRRRQPDRAGGARSPARDLRARDGGLPVADRRPADARQYAGGAWLLSFVGPRKILVGMAEPCHWADLAPPAEKLCSTTAEAFQTHAEVDHYAANRRVSPRAAAKADLAAPGRRQRGVLRPGGDSDRRAARPGRAGGGARAGDRAAQSCTRPSSARPAWRCQCR